MDGCSEDHPFCFFFSFLATIVMKKSHVVGLILAEGDDAVCVSHDGRTFNGRSKGAVIKN